MSVLTFREWVHMQLSERRWTQREAAVYTGIDASNIGMLLNGRIQQPTVRMAVRLCRGFDISLSGLLESWLGRVPALAPQRSDLLGTVVTSEDVRALIEYAAQTDWTDICTRFAGLLNSAVMLLNAVQNVQPEDALTFEVSDIEKLFYNSRMYTFELQYPDFFPLDAILSISSGGGALLFKDAGQYLRMVRQARMRERGGRFHLDLSTATMSRLEAGEGERLLLRDWLLLDEQLGQDGRLLAIYWDAFVFHECLRGYQRAPEDRETVYGPWKDDLALASQFLFLCRWLQYLSAPDSRWIDVVRSLWHSVERNIPSDTSSYDA